MSNLSEFEKLLWEEIQNLRKDISDIKQQLAGFKAKMTMVGSAVAIIVTVATNYLTR